MSTSDHFQRRDFVAAVSGVSLAMAIPAAVNATWPGVAQSASPNEQIQLESLGLGGGANTLWLRS